MIKKARLASWLACVSLACDPSDASAPPGFQGTVEYEARTLAFEVGGRLVELDVDEGDELSPDTVVARLDDGLQRVAREVDAARAQAARARVALLEAGSRSEDIRALKASMRAATSAEKLAERTYERERSLADKEIGRPADLDAASSSLSTATARRQELEQQLIRARRGARPEEVDVAEAEAAAADAAVKAADERIARHVLSTAHGGQVLEVLREEGEFAAAGAPLVILADVGHPYVDVFIPQGHPAPPQVGDPISIRVDALDESLAGVVEYIGRRTEFTPKFLFSDRERPNLVIRMRVRITDPDHRLRAGMPAFATFDEAGA